MTHVIYAFANVTAAGDCVSESVKDDAVNFPQLLDWQGVGPTTNGLYQTATGPTPGTWDLPGAAPSGSFGFQDIEDNYLPSYTRSWDDEAQAPWLYNADTGIMISYEDPQSLTAKAGYVLSNRLSAG